MKPFGLIGERHGTQPWNTIRVSTGPSIVFMETIPILLYTSLAWTNIRYINYRLKGLNSIADIVKKHALQLQNAGAKGIAICANTPHKVLPRVQDSVQVPFVHIADAVGDDMKKQGWSKVALLGTIFTMQEDFIKGKLLQDYQIECIVPGSEDQIWMQEAIVKEMSVGVFTEETIRRYIETIHSFSEKGAEAVILGCTEIPLLLRNTTPSIPTIDSLACHCAKIVSFILKDELSKNSTDFTASTL